MVIAVLAYDQDNRVTKFQRFARRNEAEAHVARFGGFVADDAGTDWPHWRVDPVARTLSADPVPTPVPDVRLTDIAASVNTVAALRAEINARLAILRGD